MSPRVRQIVALHRNQRKHLRLFTGRSDIGVPDRNSRKRIAAHQIQRQYVRHDRVTIGTEKTMSEVIDRVSKLPGAGDGFKLHRLGMKSKIDTREYRQAPSIQIPAAYIAPCRVRKSDKSSCRNRNEDTRSAFADEPA